MPDNAINPRELNRPVVLLEPAPAVTNEFGEGVSSSTAMTRHDGVWARRRETSGGEGLADQQEQSRAQVEFLIWWRPDVTESWQVWERGPTANGTVYDIEYIAEVGRREGLRIVAERKR